ncbi:hypothetical protein SBV1_340053 [Verrucomicrobia bacterium]|nr:hypothetical protein SBV1_340053 [Verrucomicrobiota bacterium]
MDQGYLAFQIEVNKAALSRFAETKHVFTTPDGRFYGSRIAPAGGTSLKSLPHSSSGRLLVMMVERFSYRA